MTALARMTARRKLLKSKPSPARKARHFPVALGVTEERAARMGEEVEVPRVQEAPVMTISRMGIAAITGPQGRAIKTLGTTSLP